MFTDRLTRAQRRKLENEAHIKLDLDNLANIDIQHLEEDLHSPATAEKAQEPKESENGNDKTQDELDAMEFDIGDESDLSSVIESETEDNNNDPSATTEEDIITEEDDTTKEDTTTKENTTIEADEVVSDSSSESEDSEDSDSSEDSDDESDNEDSEEEEDLEGLLLKAQKALSVQNTEVIELEKATKPSYSLPKLNSGLSIKDELYIKPANKKAAKLVDSAIELVSSDEKKPTNKKATLIVVANKDQEKRVSRKERQAEREKTTGKGWFDMGQTEITPEVKRDLQVLKMRHVLDRKRHYKKMGNKTDPKYFQIGTIIESPTEFFSARMTKKERKQNIVDELIANDDAKQYYKRKFNEVQERTNSGGKKHYKKLKAKKEWAK